MPVVTIKKQHQRTPSSATAALMARVQQKTETLLDAADRVLVVYEPSGTANIYYEGGAAKTGTSGAN